MPLMSALEKNIRWNMIEFSYIFQYEDFVEVKPSCDWLLCFSDIQLNPNICFQVFIIKSNDFILLKFCFILFVFTKVLFGFTVVLSPFLSSLRSWSPRQCQIWISSH